MKIIKPHVLIFIILSSFINNLSAQKDNTDRLSWWKEAKFGMFIHWGLYAVPAGIYKGKETDQIGEWIMFNENIPVNEYEKLADEFNPVKFDAKKWVNTAKKTGMKYIVITSKHHDGFGLWDSKVSDYDILDRSPYKKDILKQLAKECDIQGIKLCFYYSIWDWHHPKANKDQFDEYYKNYMVPQIKELLTEYGDIGIMWFDGEWIDEWTEEKGIELYKYILSLQPNTIINNRVGKGRSGMEGLTAENAFAADYDTPEQEVPDILLNDRSWETCMTMNDTWGYKSNDNNWKTSDDLIFKLVDIVSKGGNFLLNVGPKADGTFPKESIYRLEKIGEWMKTNSEAIYRTKPYRKYKDGESIRFTSSIDDKYLYAIVSNFDGSEIVINEINIKNGSKIKLLGYYKELDYKTDYEKIIIKYPNELIVDLSTNKYIVLKIEQTEYVKTPEIVITKVNDQKAKIDIINITNDEVVKYSLDGIIPNNDSPNYEGPIFVKKPTILKVKAFKEGFSNSLTATKIIDIPIAEVNGVNFKYYKGNNWINLPDFSKLQFENKGTVSGFEIKDIKKQEDQFAIKFNSYLKIPKTGTYNFYLDSDDGSKLLIDDKVVIDNDGSHSRIRKFAKLDLVKGFHKIELEYFEDCEGEYLELSFDSEEIPKQKIPASFLFLTRP